MNYQQAITPRNNAGSNIQTQLLSGIKRKPGVQSQRKRHSYINTRSHLLRHLHT